MRERTMTSVFCVDLINFNEDINFYILVCPFVWI
jgi:hypothetical protein